MGIPLEIIPFFVVYLYFFSGKSLLQSRSQHKTILLQNYVFFTLTYLEGIDSLSLEQKKKKKWKREIGVSKRCWHLTTLIAPHQSPVLDLEIEIFREWWNDLFAKVQMGKIGHNVSGTKKKENRKEKGEVSKNDAEETGKELEQYEGWRKWQLQLFSWGEYFSRFVMGYKFFLLRCVSRSNSWEFLNFRNSNSFVRWRNVNSCIFVFVRTILSMWGMQPTILLIRVQNFHKLQIVIRLFFNGSCRLFT